MMTVEITAMNIDVFQPATLSLGVTMENVDLKATNVMVLMTVVITVMKRDVLMLDSLWVSPWASSSCSCSLGSPFALSSFITVLLVGVADVPLFKPVLLLPHPVQEELL